MKEILDFSDSASSRPLSNPWWTWPVRISRLLTSIKLAVGIYDVISLLSYRDEIPMNWLVRAFQVIAVLSVFVIFYQMTQAIMEFRWLPSRSRRRYLKALSSAVLLAYLVLTPVTMSMTLYPPLSALGGLEYARVSFAWSVFALNLMIVGPALARDIAYLTFRNSSR